MKIAKEDFLTQVIMKWIKKYEKIKLVKKIIVVFKLKIFSTKPLPVSFDIIRYVRAPRITGMLSKFE